MDTPRFPPFMGAIMRRTLPLLFLTDPANLFLALLAPTGADAAGLPAASAPPARHVAKQPATGLR